ncbi:glycosyltransferase [Flavobacterium defluvii]|uniref:Glycosyltransferase involved in cell wall bisynthesis n=1 Tax=Flavobacterium defluvii TaxID=370979 RepID=A0A1M5NSC9_9FLAO|nr:glycosyltransferase [Flavobacterium defluvii]SHG92368.1 Glycosyltransferase involved in cell wall bisynthesis [Flavobacterium defluvii]
MRIVQIIDSLESGGAERMAVNYANALCKKIEFSGLIATRKEGQLLSQIDKQVSYLFLKKNKSIDLKAVSRLRQYLKNNKVEVIHAHSSSFFIAILVKFVLPQIKIVWHDHYGISQDLSLRKNLSLKLGSFFFSGIISVNSSLKNWALSYLSCPNAEFFPNFIGELYSTSEKMVLKGNDGKRIICLANLRPQKNHEFLIDTAYLICSKNPDWSFHLLGKDFQDSHSELLYKKVNDLKLQEHVFFYGSINNVGKALEQCDIAVLPSISEGLPLAVLEYGLYKLPVIATNVGEISKIIISEKEGFVIESNNIEQFNEVLQSLIDNEKKRIELGQNLNKVVSFNYSEEAIINDYILWLNSLPNFAK